MGVLFLVSGVAFLIMEACLTAPVASTTVTHVVVNEISCSMAPHEDLGVFIPGYDLDDSLDDSFFTRMNNLDYFE